MAIIVTQVGETRYAKGIIKYVRREIRSIRFHSLRLLAHTCTPHTSLFAFPMFDAEGRTRNRRDTCGLDEPAWFDDGFLSCKVCGVDGRADLDSLSAREVRQF